MHLTDIVLKDGRRFLSVIERMRFDADIFEHSYIMLHGDLFYIKDIYRALTLNERVTHSKRIDVDEIERMRKIWEQYKKGEIKGIPLVEAVYKLPSEH